MAQTDSHYGYQTLIDKPNSSMHLAMITVLTLI